METKKYLVKLTPHDKFFFGGEKNFGQKDKNSTEKDETNYLVKSNYFPQQTGVLGFVRHQLLLQCNDENIFSNNKIQDKEKAGALIGKQSFRTNEEFSFGNIASLSPIFICKSQETDTYYFPANKEYQLDEKGEEHDFLEIEFDNLPLLKGYDAKKGLPDLLMSSSGSIKTYNDVFKEAKQVGITKKYEGGTDNDAYYIQTFLKFKKGFSFAFIVELEKNVIFNSQNIVIFGGEQQAFKMEIEPFTKEFNSITPDYRASKNADKIVLISDAFVTDDITKECEFAITETIGFRFLKSNTENNGNYYKKPQKSNKYSLYKKGSTFYGDIQKIEKLLDVENFRKLGYNHYKPINKN